MSKERYLRLGELLIKEGLIDEAQLEKAISIQRKEGGRLGEIFLKSGMVKEVDMVKALSKQMAIPHYSLENGMLRPMNPPVMQKMIPHDFANKNAVIAISRDIMSLTVAMNDPLDLILIDNLKKLTGCEINPVIATKSDIIRAIDELYGKSAMLKDAVEASYDITSVVTSDERDGHEEELSLEKLIARAEEAPVVKLVDLIIRQAINEGASDIHIEPFKDRLALRYRIDGKLYEIPPPAKHLSHQHYVRVLP